MRSMVLLDTTYQATALGVIQGEIRRVPSVINVYALVANTAQTITIPTGAEQALLNASNSTGTAQVAFYACDASIATAAVPTGSITTGLGVEWNPTSYNVRLTTALSVISPSSGYLYVSFYSGPQNAAAA